MGTATGNPEGASLYEALADRMRQLILVGEYQPGDLLGSEHSLARQERISRMTVRKASELLINEGLIERRPGKGLYVSATPGASQQKKIQVVSGNLAWEPSLQVSRGVQAVAKSHGIQVQLYDANGDMDLDLQMLRQLPSSSASGAVIMSLHSPDFAEAVYQLKLRGYPFVLVDQKLHDIEVPSVRADNYSGGYQVGQMLVEMKHRQIAFVGDLIADSVQDRLAGLRDAMADAALPFNRSLVVDLLQDKDRMGDWSGSVDRAVQDLMSRPTPPTAIFCSCDGVAKLTYRTLMAMGISIPVEVSVVGFDDDPIAEWLPPPLTTVRQPFNAMGVAAIELLRKRMLDPAAPVEHRVLPVELIRRASASLVKAAGGRPSLKTSSSGGVR